MKSRIVSLWNALLQWLRELREPERWRRRWQRTRPIFFALGSIWLAALGISIVAFASAVLWIGVEYPFLVGLINRFSDKSKELIFVLEQLADWIWRGTLLGAFAFVVYERVKRFDASNAKLEAFRTSLETMFKTSHYDSLELEYKSFTKFRSDNRDFVARDLDEQFARAFHTSVLQRLDTASDLNALTEAHHYYDQLKTENKLAASSEVDAQLFGKYRQILIMHLAGMENNPDLSVLNEMEKLYETLKTQKQFPRDSEIEEHILTCKMGLLRRQIEHARVANDPQTLHLAATQYRDWRGQLAYPEIQELLANAYCELALRAQTTTEWEESYTWLSKAKAIQPEHPLTNLVLDFPNNLISDKTENVLRGIQALEQLHDFSLPGFLIHHATAIQHAHPAIRRALLQRIEIASVNERSIPLKNYVIHIVLEKPQNLSDAAYNKLLSDYLFDNPEMVRQVLDGRAEAEPQNLFAYDPEHPDKSSYCLRKSVSLLAEMRHTVVKGDDGAGKTTLLRLLLEESRLRLEDERQPQKYLCVHWTSAIPWLEEKREVLVSDVVLSLMQDIQVALPNDLYLALQDLGKETDEPKPWRAKLARLKAMLWSNGIRAIFICLDGLDHYPEVRRDKRRLMELLTVLLRPEIEMDGQPWFVKLFVSPMLFSELQSAFRGTDHFREILLAWEPRDLKEVFEGRLKYLAGDSHAPTGWKEIITWYRDGTEEEQIQQFFGTFKTPRELLTRFETGLETRARSYAAATDKDKDLQRELQPSDMGISLSSSSDSANTNNSIESIGNTSS